MNRYLLLLLSLCLLVISCNNDDLPILEIETKETIQWVYKIPCNIRYIDDGSSKEYKASIKSRGGSSKRFFKHSYRIEFNNKIGLANLPKDDDWILNASYIDKTFMRHKICYDIFKQMNPQNIAAKSSYVQTYVNGEYKGLYLLMEKVNASMIGLDKSDSMSMLFKDPPVFIQEQLSYVEDSTNYYEQKFPKISDQDFSTVLDSFKNFLFYSSDSVFAAQIEQWVVLENIIDWQLILLFSNNSDGLLKNFYLYKKNKQTPFQIAIWDYDHSFGRDGDNELNLHERVINCERSILFKRLASIEVLQYENLLKERWTQLRSSNIISLDHFIELQQQNDKLISKYIKKNEKLWPHNSTFYFDDNSYDKELEIMRSFVQQRIVMLDKRFDFPEHK